MRKLTIIIAALLISGCGSMNRLRGYNIWAARDAINAAKQPLDKAFEEKKDAAETDEDLKQIENEHLIATYDLADADRRLGLAQIDFPAPKTPDGEKPVKRTTLTEPSKEDEFRFAAYAGRVAKRADRRAFWNALGDELRKIAKVWDWTIWGLTAAIYVIIIIIVLFVVMKLRWVYYFLSNLLDELPIDKEAKARLASDTPVEAAYRRKQRKYRKKYKYGNTSSSTPTSD